MTRVKLIFDIFSVAKVKLNIKNVQKKVLNYRFCLSNL